MPKKTERQDPLGFSTSFLLQNSKKIEGGGVFRGNFFLRKVAQCRKNGPFGLVRYCMFRGKPKEKRRLKRGLRVAYCHVKMYSFVSLLIKFCVCNLVIECMLVGRRLR